MFPCLHVYFLVRLRLRPSLAARPSNNTMPGAPPPLLPLLAAAREQPMPPVLALAAKHICAPLLSRPHSFDWQSLSETQLAPTPPAPADEGGIGGADDVGGACVPPAEAGGVLVLPPDVLPVPELGTTN